MYSRYRRHTALLAGALLATITTGTSCTRSASKDDVAPGLARLLVTCGTSSACAPIERVTVTVTPGDGPEFQPIVEDLARSGDQWTGRITDVPSGPGRLFAAVARDKDGNKLYAGEGKSDIAPGAAAVISIFLNGTSTGGPQTTFPVIDSLTMSRSQVAPGRTMKAAVTAHDAGGTGPLTYWWRATCGAFDDASRTAPAWTAPAAEGTCQLSITVANARGAAVTASLMVTVTSALADITVIAQINNSPIITSLTGRVTLGAAMEGDLTATAADPDGDPITYDWTSDCPGLAFDFHVPYGRSTPHLTFPGPSDACKVTLTVTDGPVRGGSTQATLTLPPNRLFDGKCNNVTCQTGQACDPADGICKGAPNLCAAVTCAASDRCHDAGVCDPATGQCSAGAARVCAAGQACDLADGVCKAPAGLCTGVTCAASDRCHDPGVCAPASGQCSAGAAKVCSTGQTCDLADGVCKSPATSAPLPRPRVAKSLPLASFVGLAIATDGSSYVTGTLRPPTRTFDNLLVTSAGAADAFVARYGPDGAAVWARNYGDAGDQVPTAVAVTGDGTVANIGQFTGNLTPSLGNARSTPIDYLLGLNASDGSVKFAKGFNNGVSGVLLAVAANPALNRIATCGFANQAATDLVPGATYGGGNQDIVIAVFDSAGNRLWSKQVGGANEEECDALAIDDAGDVYAAGKYDGALGFTGTPLPSPGSSFRRWLWIAKFDGATGAAISQASFGAGAGNHRPAAMVVDSSGMLVISGYLTNSLNFGTTPATLLTSAGSNDAFVAKIDPAAATPFGLVWSTRIGGVGADDARGVAVDSSGDVIAVGLFNGSTTGAATLTSVGSTVPSLFVVKLDGGTGMTQHAAPGGAVYGNVTNGAAANAVVVNRRGAGAVKDLVVLGGEFTGLLDFGAPTTQLNVDSAQDFLVFARLLP
jgi:hypothetical protein